MDNATKRFAAREGLANARYELERCRKEYRRQYRNQGFRSESAAAAVLSAREAVIECEREMFALDCDHMGFAAACALWKRDSETLGKRCELIFKPWKT
jgi:hypothetical protein